MVNKQLINLCERQKHRSSHKRAYGTRTDVCCGADGVTAAAASMPASAILERIIVVIILFALIYSYHTQCDTVRCFVCRYTYIYWQLARRRLCDVNVITVRFAVFFAIFFRLTLHPLRALRFCASQTFIWHFRYLLVLWSFDYIKCVWARANEKRNRIYRDHDWWERMRARRLQPDRPNLRRANKHMRVCVCVSANRFCMHAINRISVNRWTKTKVNLLALVCTSRVTPSHRHTHTHIHRPHAFRVRLMVD